MQATFLLSLFTNILTLSATQSQDSGNVSNSCRLHNMKRNIGLIEHEVSKILLLLSNQPIKYSKGAMLSPRLNTLS
ncbi:hypothetical protein F4801DRAFT_279156 [Xylaria longipes]|nr:hypothetical protein F4801DRAFT_279156 [Xylaria longipes]